MDLKKIVKITKLPFEPGKNPELIQPSDPQKITTYEPQELVISWDVEVPPFSLSKIVLRSVIVMSVFFGFFLIIVSDWVFLILLLTLAFFANVIMSYGKKSLTYTVYTNGIQLNETFYSWDKFNYFFHYEGEEGLFVITTKEIFPGRLYLYLDINKKDKIDSVLMKYLPKNPVHPKDFYEVVLIKIRPYLNLSDEKQVQ